LQHFKSAERSLKSKQIFRKVAEKVTSVSSPPVKNPPGIERLYVLNTNPILQIKYREAYNFFVVFNVLFWNIFELNTRTQTHPERERERAA